MRHIFLSLVCTAAMVTTAHTETLRPLHVEWKPPAEGIVPNAGTAGQFRLRCCPTWGAKASQEIQEFQPWHAGKVGDAWQVRGTLPADTLGGTYVVVIAQGDARVISIFHEQ